ncbi:MAG TPA: tetratricopeptide repeat protein, partial [Bacteroidota bacterium]
MILAAKQTIIGLLLVCGLAAPRVLASSQQDTLVFRGDVEKEFVDAMRNFTAQRFDSAAALFSRILKVYPRSHRTTGTYIMGAKAYYRVGNYRESIKLLKDLMDLYPQSRYIDDAHYSLGLDFYQLGRYEDAAGEFLAARQLSHSSKLIGMSERILEILAMNQLTVAELQLMLPDATVNATKALLNYAIALKVFRTGDVKSAQDILRTVASLPPDNKYVSDAA